MKKLSEKANGFKRWVKENDVQLILLGVVIVMAAKSGHDGIGWIADSNGTFHRYYNN